MADKKFSEFTDQGANIDPTDYLVGLYSSDNMRAQIQDATKKVWLDSGTSPAYRAYQLWADSTNGCITADTGFTDVRCCLGFELYVPVYNDTGVTIANGTPVEADGTYTSGVPNVVPADADSPTIGVGFFGVATQDILDGTLGAVTAFGAVNGVDTSGLSQAPVYVASGGGLTNTAPKYPATKVLVGGATVIDASNGTIGVGPVRLRRSIIPLEYNFTSANAAAGTYYIAGSYDFSSTDANLTQASTSITYGTANHARGTHAAIVAGAAGTVDTGQVGLRVTGTSYTNDGTRTTSDTEVLTDDITTLSTDQYLETSKDWLGQVTFELYDVSGTPTTYSLDFNYGFSGYIDVSNTDFSIEGVRAEGIAGANDSSFNVTLQKHSNTGWTYAATGFTPGNGVIADLTTDLSTDSDLVNGLPFKWKRAQLNEFIEGSGSDGFLIKVTTGANNSVQTMTISVKAYTEELF